MEFYQVTQVFGNNLKENNRQERQRLKKPFGGIVEINWDVALDKLYKKIGAGVIARDSERFVQAIICIKLHFIINPTVAETVVAWKAFEFYRDLGIQQVIINSDALKIVHVLQQEGSIQC